MILARTAPEPTISDVPTAETIVSIRGLSKQFPVQRSWIETLRRPFGGTRVSVVQDVTCDIRRGEFFGLLGPNGAGKTTLFKMLSTMVIPDSGTAVVAGYDVVQNPQGVRESLTPVVAEERSLNWRLSAEENLKVFAALYGLRGTEARARVAEVLEAVEMSDTGHKMVGKFSSGMRQRLLIARALLARPKVLLLDEPTRSLDPVSARRFRNFLREEIVGRQGCTAILATHSTEEALELCDRVGVLARGRLLAVGTPDSLSREVVQERYRIWTRNPSHRSFASLSTQGTLRIRDRHDPESDGWSIIEVEIPGGPEEAAAVLTRLALDGAEVYRFERASSSLADLIDHIVNHHGGRREYV